MSEAGVTPSESTLIPGFILHLDNFDGPFDLLLQLISRHKMDVTEVALSVVTDEFIAHIRSMDGGWKLETATEFLVVAATLLDLKAARLLPSGEIEDEEDLALLEATKRLPGRCRNGSPRKSADTRAWSRWSLTLRHCFLRS
jgi:segregation and condensation protein A